MQRVVHQMSMRMGLWSGMALSLLGGLVPCVAEAEEGGAQQVGLRAAELLLAGWARDDVTSLQLHLSAPTGPDGMSAALGNDLLSGVREALVAAPGIEVVASPYLDALWLAQRRSADPAYRDEALTRGIWEPADHALYLSWQPAGAAVALSLEVASVERALIVASWSGQMPLAEPRQMRAAHLGEVETALSALLPDETSGAAVVLPFVDQAGLPSEVGEGVARWWRRALQERVRVIPDDAFYDVVEELGLHPPFSGRNERRRLRRALPGLGWIVQGTWWLEEEEVRVQVEALSVEGEPGIRSAVAHLPLSSLPVDRDLASHRGVVTELRPSAPATGPLGLWVTTDRGAGASYGPGEELRLHLGGRGEAWLYIYSTDEAGQSRQLFPNRFMADNCVDLERGLTLPPEGTRWFEIGPPYGIEHITVVATDRPSTSRFDTVAAAGGAVDHRQIRTRAISVIGEEPAARAVADRRCTGAGLADAATISVRTVAPDE